jgi:chromate transporter
MSVGNALEVFIVFLRLGLTSFGGPVAHISFFRRELVERRQWVSESQFAQLIAISQFLPGPASSQLGFALGLLRARWAGAVAAFIGFTLPSALLLFGFAMLLPQLSGPVGTAAIHGLKLVALAVVAHGVMTMAKQLCPDPQRAAIATAAAVVILLFGGVVVQLLAVILGGVAGIWLCRAVDRTADSEITVAYGARLGWSLLGLFVLLLLVLPQLAQGGMLAALFEAFYRAGALVFGGGHVLLPMLEETVVGSGWVTADDFVAGYGAAQAVPGPMFTIAAFLGASASGVDSGWLGAAVALLAIFLPGLLLVSAALPLWQMLSRHPAAASAVTGVNAAVVGLLGAALYDPLWTSAVRDATDVAIALVGFTMISAARLSVLYVVLWCVLASVLAGQFLP